MSFPFIAQPDSMDCGPACLSMISEYYGNKKSIENLRNDCFISKYGVSLLGISKAAENIGLKSIGGKLAFESLSTEVLLPCIVHWNQNHFVVVYRIKKHRKKDYTIYIADPGKGLITYNKNEFLEHWASTVIDGERKGIALLLEPTDLFYLHKKMSRKIIVA